MILPTEIETVLVRLEQAGYEAWLVGGCVRDTLMGRPIHDWDIATSALPEQTMALFPKAVPTGLRHGTVTVLLGNLQAEVTTFRTDGAYCDGRHPEQVRFVRRLEDDLARRDFTVNAMAMDRRGKLTDLFGGQADLRAGIIRCVGDPDTRFHEDALRMLRAVRFSAQLGFTISSKTLAAIGRCAPLASCLSAERVRDEVEKTLLSPHPSEVATMASLGLLARFSSERQWDLTALQALPAVPVIRWAGLLRAVPTLRLEDFRLPKAVSRAAQQAVARCQDQFSPVDLRRLAADLGPQTARITAALCGCSVQLETELAAGNCLSLRELAVTGADLPHLSGPEVGRTLHRLLDHVLAHPEDNRREVLLPMAAAEDREPVRAFLPKNRT